MKELNIEEKAKRYDDLLVKLQEAKADNNVCDERYCCVIDDIVPELQESEDEKIKKAIIKCLKWLRDEARWIDIYGISFDSIFAWLEKQNHDGKKWIYEDVYLKEKEQLIQDGIDEVLENPQKYGLEKQGEQKEATCVSEIIDRLTPKEQEILFKELEMQKPTDKVEPKFHEGDWIVYNISKDVFLIKSFNSGYFTLEDINGNIYTTCLPPTEYDYHLWTIQDAKDGDVLACNEEILLFKSYSVQNRISLYCWYNGQTNNFHSKGVNDTLLTTRNKICPATKKQRDTLMEAMADAGYAFDFEKKELKELKKIEQNSIEPDDLIEESYQQQADDLIDIVTEKPAWSEEDEKMVKDIIAAIDTLYYHGMVNWLKSIKDRVQPQPRQKWSEEDESILQGIWDEILANKHDAKEYEWKTYDKFLNWLKSLKPQSTWKPSDEQMEILQYLCETSSHPNEKVIPTLKSLYQDLKKLKG